MDLATVLGVVAGILAIVISIYLGGTLGAFIDIPSAFVVIGGTIAATLINYTMEEVLSVVKVVKNAFFHKLMSPAEFIKKLVSLSEIARREGVLALESAASDIEDDFMQRGIQLAVDGTAPELIRSILETELSYLEERHKLGQSIFEAMGAFFPAFGMIGTLIGLINMLKTLDDPTQIGAGMAVALITTFYGAVLANLVCIPIAGKLKNRTERETLVKELTIEGIMSIQAGDNPRVVEEKLKAFLSPSLRREVSKER